GARSSPETHEPGRHRQTARAPQARQKGETRSEPVVEPPQVQFSAPTWRMWAEQAVRARSSRGAGDSDGRSTGPAGRPRGRTAAYSWRGCQGKSWSPTLPTDRQ